MKRMLSIAVTAVMLCGLPVFAAAPQQSSGEVMPAAWLDPIQVPEAQTVQSVFRYDKAGRGYSLRRSTEQSTADAVCAVLNSLKAEEVLLNVPDISYIPAERAPGDTVYEVRTGDAQAMRYYVDKAGTFLISQRVEAGMMYQGMKFTGGNVADVISRLNSITSYENTGSLPFGMPLRLEAINLYNYRDMTCTRILSRDLISRVEDLLNIVVDPQERSRPVSQSDYGDQFRDLHDMTLILQDGTRLTVRLYEEGVIVFGTEENLNVPKEQSYYTDKPVYDQLIGLLRAHQSACSPAWLYGLDPYRITGITLTGPDGAQSKTFRPGERDFDYLWGEVQGITVEPLSFQERARRSYPEGGYTIRIELNDDTVYVVDYGTDTVEVEAAGKEYVASYKLARGYRDGTRYLERLLA